MQITLNRLLLLLIILFRLNNISWAQTNNDSLAKQPDYNAILENLRGHKSVSDLTEALKDPQNVQWLDLSFQSLDSLPKIILNFPNIIGLDISNNNLKVLPEWIGKLKPLREFNLRQNKINFLPSGFFDLTNLENIDLWGNLLVKIPNEIGRLKQLAQLNISANKLKDLPATFDELDNLTVLAMELNEFREIPIVVTKLKSLRSLHVYHNKISDFPSSITKLSKLVDLSLSYNNLNNEQIEQIKKALPNCKIYSENQGPSVDYIFFKDILPQIKYHNKGCNQLVENPAPVILKTMDRSKYIKELSSFIDSVEIMQLIKYSQSQPIYSGTFDGTRLKEVKLVSMAKLDSLEKDSLQGVFKPLLFTSLPIFDDKKEYAVIEFSMAESLSKGMDSKYLFRKIKNRWKLITSFDSINY